jgi:hypothetical protein
LLLLEIETRMCLHVETIHGRDRRAVAVAALRNGGIRRATSPRPRESPELEPLDTAARQVHIDGMLAVEDVEFL